MRALYLGLAAVACVVALLFKFLGITDLGAVVALLVAGTLLVMGLRVVAGERISQPLAPDEKQLATLRELKSRGDEGAAIRQVQLWFRDTTAEQARRLVHDLD
ncbi:hypothetical protein [Corynebacterium alimapuense]|uniref:Uncharacterized protein n=1 Tax=Corynebacterium alimapuense TaxID=1576874 RepID=A0A3M8K926_9CORY|nr:hypothetical protein [Corynebacterium alimapuense]RNE49636.1 hypothetical protein C5L39_04670 [Corynebacterium alimapuense]